MAISILDYGACNDGSKLTTVAIQQALDEAAKTGDRVIVPAGKYLTGSLFIASGVELHFEKDAVLLGSENIADYPQIATRIAGIEMEWPAAIINILDAKDVTVSGLGTIDGQGECWWELYWGKDGKGGRRVEFDAKDLRWIADYEIQRPRLMLVQNSHDIVIEDITARRSGFWTVQLTYSHDVTVDNITVCDNAGPSTDGIDVDSCRDVIIRDCEIACNDDDIVIKSGRDADGQRVNKICERVTVENCLIKSGAGITIGSEVSGGIRDISILNNRFENSDCGFRIKSSKLRGGFIRDIEVSNLTMHNVQFPFSWILDWHPAYNTFILPEGDVPEYWRRVAESVPPEKQYTAVENIKVEHITGTYDADYDKSARAFDLQGATAKPMQQLVFHDVKLATAEYGNIAGVADIKFDNVMVTAPKNPDASNDTYDQR